ncbi:MAG: OsmC family protein [Thermoleophilaceae bacterium]
MAAHRYSANAHWHGSTGQGWEHYGRAHEVTAPPAEQTLTVTTGESAGDPRHLNPEQLLLMAASTCQLLWFLHVAAKARIDVVEYRDEAEAEMPDDDKPVRITRIALRPTIVVHVPEGGQAPSEERIRSLSDLAHRECYIANSLRSEVTVEPRLELADAEAV